jgi:hypothetical protein
MSFDPGMRGLSLEQAPPLSIPMSFVLTTPVMIAAGGVLLATSGPATLASRWAPSAMAAVHLGTLGALAMTMLGALYQMLPVVAGQPVPAPRLANAVHAALVLGLVALTIGLSTGLAPAFVAAGALLAAAFLAFLVPAAIAASRARVTLDTVPGMRIAIVTLVVVITLGLELALGRAGVRAVPWPAQRLLAHAGLGFVVWVGGLIVPVSWQVVPMFYLTEPYPRWSRLLALGAGAFALAGTVVALLAGAGPTFVAIALAPAAVVVWLVHPIVTARLILGRRRRRVGESVRFWLAALVVAPLVLASAVLGFFLDDPRFVVLFGWLALVGWSTVIVHGMLTRIVPFLVWFHRFSRAEDLANAPSMREILPDARARVGLVLHLASAIVGALAIATGASLLVVLAGALLVATGASMLVAFARALARRPAAPTA